MEWSECVDAISCTSDCFGCAQECITYDDCSDEAAEFQPDITCAGEMKLISIGVRGVVGLWPSELR